MKKLLLITSLFVFLGTATFAGTKKHHHRHHKHMMKADDSKKA